MASRIYNSHSPAPAHPGRTPRAGHGTRILPNTTTALARSCERAIAVRLPCSHHSLRRVLKTQMPGDAHAHRSCRFLTVSSHVRPRQRSSSMKMFAHFSPWYLVSSSNITLHQHSPSVLARLRGAGIHAVLSACTNVLCNNRPRTVPSPYAVRALSPDSHGIPVIPDGHALSTNFDPIPVYRGCARVV